MAVGLVWFLGPGRLVPLPTSATIRLQNSGNSPPAAGLGLAAPRRCGGAASARRSGARLINPGWQLFSGGLLWCAR